MSRYYCMDGETDPAFVYFMRSERTGLVKVGFTRDLLSRMTGVSVLEGAPCLLMGVHVCCLPRRAEERLMHTFLEPWRVHGEWFRIGFNHMRAAKNEVAKTVRRMEHEKWLETA